MVTCHRHHISCHHIIVNFWQSADALVNKWEHLFGKVNCEQINIPPFFKTYFCVFSHLCSLCAHRVAGRLPSAEAAGDPGFFQHAAAQLQCRREGPQKAGTLENGPDVLYLSGQVLFLPALSVQ